MTQEAVIAEDEKSPTAFRTIREVSEILDVPQHVLRFWEEKFPQVKPLYRSGRRYYRPQDIEVLTSIKTLLYKEGYTIKGAKKMFGPGKAVLPESVPEQEKSKQLSDKQASQLAVIRQELVGLRDLLKPHMKTPA